MVGHTAAVEVLSLLKVKMVRQYLWHTGYHEERYTYQSLEMYAATMDPVRVGFVQSFWRVEGRVAVERTNEPDILLSVQSTEDFDFSHRVFLGGKLYTMDEFRLIDPDHKYLLRGCINEKQESWEKMVIRLDLYDSRSPEQGWFFFYPGDKLLTPTQEETEPEQLAQSA